MHRPRSSLTSGRSTRPSTGLTRRSRRSTTRWVRSRAAVGGRIEALHGNRQRHDTGTAILLLLPLLVLVVGLRNYIYLANDDAFRTVVRNSLVFTVSSVALKIVTGLAMALVLHAT